MASLDINTPEIQRMGSDRGRTAYSQMLMSKKYFVFIFIFFIIPYKSAFSASRLILEQQMGRSGGLLHDCNVEPNGLVSLNCPKIVECIVGELRYKYQLRGIALWYEKFLFEVGGDLYDNSNGEIRGRKMVIKVADDFSISLDYFREKHIQSGNLASLFELSPERKARYAHEAANDLLDGEKFCLSK